MPVAWPRKTQPEKQTCLFISPVFFPLHTALGAKHTSKEKLHSYIHKGCHILQLNTNKNKNNPPKVHLPVPHKILPLHFTGKLGLPSHAVWACCGSEKPKKKRPDMVRSASLKHWLKAPQAYPISCQNMNSSGLQAERLLSFP